MKNSIRVDRGEKQSLGIVQDDSEDAVVSCAEIAICHIDIPILPQHIQSMHDGKQPTFSTVAGDTMTGEVCQPDSTKHDSMKLADVEIGKQEVIVILRRIDGIFSDCDDPGWSDGWRECDDRINV